MASERLFVVSFGLRRTDVSLRLQSELRSISSLIAFFPTPIPSGREGSMNDE